jgi:hypothetical protein
MKIQNQSGCMRSADICIDARGVQTQHEPMWWSLRIHCDGTRDKSLENFSYGLVVHPRLAARVPTDVEVV